MLDLDADSGIFEASIVNEFNVPPIFNYEEPDLEIVPRFEGKCTSDSTAPPSAVEESDPD